MRKVSFYLLLILCCVPLLVVDYSSTVAQAGDADTLIAEVNQLRSANGLPPLQVNPILMDIAQAHSDYQASIDTVTHIDPGGTRPKERAIAAGYGGGAAIFLSENVAGGRNLSPGDAVFWWQEDEIHLNTMLGANYLEIGAGVAESNGVVYYTIDVGYVPGSSLPSSTPIPGTPSATPEPDDEVVLATPGGDGSIVHVVQPGQTLIGIAEAYDVPLNKLIELNGFSSDTVIYPGDEVLIKAGFTPTPTNEPTQTGTPTRRPTITRSPTRTATPTPQVTPAVLESSGGDADDVVTERPAEPTTDILGIVLIVLIAVFGLLGVALLVVGTVLKRRSTLTHVDTTD
jgi:LysM repeat protein